MRHVSTMDSHVQLRDVNARECARRQFSEAR